MLKIFVRGIFGGVLVGLLTSLLSPVFIGLISLFTSIITGRPIGITPLLVFFELYIITVRDAFVYYLIPCISIGVLTMFFKNRKYLSLLICVLISGISSYLIWTGMFRGFGLNLYALPLTFIIIAFQYICFFAQKEFWNARE